MTTTEHTSTPTRRHGDGLPRPLRVRQRLGRRDRLVRRGLRRRRDGPLRRRRRPHRTRRGVDRQRPADALRRVPGDRRRRPADVGRHPVHASTSNVDDVDAVWARAIEHGADGERPPTDQPYGERSCTFRDPSGHRWSVQTTIATPTPDEIAEAMEGYTVVTSAPAALAPAPFEHGSRGARVLHAGLHRHGDGVTLLPRAVRLADGAGERRAPSTPMSTTRSCRSGSRLTGSTALPCCTSGSPTREAYAARVRELGGTVVSEATYDSGGNVVCRDDQGREFQLWQPAPGY